MNKRPMTDYEQFVMTCGYLQYSLTQKIKRYTDMVEHLMHHEVKFNAAAILARAELKQTHDKALKIQAKLTKIILWVESKRGAADDQPEVVLLIDEVASEPIKKPKKLVMPVRNSM